MIRIGEEDTTKRKKSDKNTQQQKKNQTKESSGPSCHASVESRIIQSQEHKSEGEKMTRKKKREEISPRFPCVRFLKHAAVITIRTPRSRSSSLFARNRTETLGTEAKKTV